jgi:hypothetical protein
MASYQAIETISDVLMRLLQASHAPDDFDGNRLGFALYRGDDFDAEAGKEVTTGVSLFLYRVEANETMRTPPGKRLSSGQRQRSQLPLDLHYLFTIWAGSASMQHRIAGWLMRTLETTPVLPKGLLHGARPEVFGPDETVEIVLNDLSNEDLFRIWDRLGPSYRLSIPYLVRNVRVESRETIPAGTPVERRLFDAFNLDPDQVSGGTS